VKVGIGSIEVDDETRKAIRKSIGGKGLASRDDVKAFVEQALADAYENVKNPAPEQPEASDEDGADDDDEVEFTDEYVEAATPDTAPPAGDALPEPPSAGVSSTYTPTPSAGTF
jgi:hypothetical protein